MKHACNFQVEGTLKGGVVEKTTTPPTMLSLTRIEHTQAVNGLLYVAGTVALTLLCVLMYLPHGAVVHMAELGVQCAVPL